MNSIKILHIAVHLGGGAGKAISGMILSAGDKVRSQVVLLEEPCNYFYYNQLDKANVHITVTEDTNVIVALINEADVVVVNWWGHPLMIKVLLQLPEIKCRAIVWNHINGCAYPYLWIDFLKCFDKLLFTSMYSLDNPYWSDDERTFISEKASVIFGMGNFEPESIEPKADYDIKNQYVIGYAGTINYAKMNLNILDYYEKAIQEICNVKIVMLGEPSEDFLADIHRRGIFDFFAFPGYVENIFDFYREMDVFAYFLNENSYATTENSLIEAMAIGLPIIVLNNPVENHIIENRVNGLVIDNAEQFIEAIRWLQEGDNACKLGNSARKYSISCYSAWQNSEKFYDICYGIMSEEPHNRLFKLAFGNDAYDAFERQAFGDIRLFERLLKSELLTDDEYNMIPNIYKEKDKASVHQFVRYFSEDKRLNLLERRIEKHEN